MRRVLKIVLLTLVLFVVAFYEWDPDTGREEAGEPAEGRPSERERIEGLLRAMERSDVVFLRNGSEHAGSAAAEHLRRKWRHVGDRIRTAEQFIAHIATRSSTSGRPYQVRLADGTVVGTDTWLSERLRAAAPGE